MTRGSGWNPDWNGKCWQDSAGSEHVWQPRFYDFKVWSARKRVEKLLYMHRNPVERGLVQEPEQWRWSSFRSYAYDEPGAVRINQWGPVVITRPAEAA